MATKGHELAMAFIYMSPVHLDEYYGDITPEQLADHMETSFEVPGVGLNRESLIKQMEEGCTTRSNISKDDRRWKLWNAAIRIIKARGEYM